MTKKNDKKRSLDTMSLRSMETNEQSPDFIIAGLRDMCQQRLTVHSKIFIDSILQPLESKKGNFVDFLQRYGNTHVPFLLNLCSLPMSDVTCDEKATIADRFWKALIDADIPITLAAVKSRLTTLIENEQSFDVWEMLMEIETAFDLVPDEDIFTLLMQRLSLTGNLKAMDSMIKQIEGHNLAVNMHMKVSQIYCYLKVGECNAAEKMVQSALTEYGMDIEPLILRARCRAAIENRKIGRFRQLLDSLLSADFSLRLFTDEMVVEFVWLLARSSIDSTGKENEQLCTEMLQKVKKEPGFFKLMSREAERHAVHGMFFSALSYFHNSLHETASSNAKSDLGRHISWIGCFSKALTNADLSLTDMKALFVHINQNIHHGCFLLERILFFVLTHRLYPNDRRLLETLELLKIIDPTSTRIHIIVPLLVRATTVEERLKVLKYFVSAGYSDLNHLNYRIIRNLVLQPLLGKNDGDADVSWDAEQLTRIASILAEHIPEESVYKLLGSTVVGNNRLKEWLSRRINRDDTNTKNVGQISLGMLRKYVANEDVSHIYELIKKNGLANVSVQLSQPIITLFIRKAHWNILIDFIKMVCNSGSSSAHLTVDNVLMILARLLEECKDLNVTCNFVHELKQIIPKELHHSNMQNQTAPRKLVQKCLELPHETVESLMSCSQLFRIVADTNWIQSGAHEIVSTLFASAALAKFGFEDALKVCDSFQFSNFPNGIICLLHRACGLDNNDLVNKALSIAKTYWPEWKVNVTSAGVMISVGKLDSAISFLQKADIRWINVLHTYQLLCALHLDEAHNFHFNYLNLFSNTLGCDKNDEAYIRLTLDCLENCTRKDPEQADLVKSLFKENSVNTSALQKTLDRLRPE